MFVTFFSLFSFENTEPPKIDIPHLDKAVHFTFYFVACILGVLFLREFSKGNMKLIRALVLMAVGTIFFGAVMEMMQHTLTENRAGDYVDAFANAFGSLSGAFVMNWFFSAKRGLKWKY